VPALKKVIDKEINTIMDTNPSSLTFAERRARVARKVILLRGLTRVEVQKQGSFSEILELPSSCETCLPNEVYVYRPELLSEDYENKFIETSPVPRPALFTFHGGGFALGHALLIEKVCIYICRKAGIPVFNIEYLKTPEHPYPEALNQIDEILQYVAENASTWNIDPHQFFLMGLSAGANLAAVCALRAREQSNYTIRGQILHYPYLDVATPFAEKDPGTHIEVDEISEFYDEFYAPASKRTLSHVSPVYATETELAGIAPALCVTAEYDILRAEAVLYVEKLKSAGVEAEELVIAGMSHAYIEQWASSGSYANEIGVGLPGSGFIGIWLAAIEALDASARFINAHTKR